MKKKKMIKRSKPVDPDKKSSFIVNALLIAVIIAFFFIVKTSNEIINYPDWLTLSVFLISAVLVGTWFWRQVRHEMKKEKGYSLIVTSFILVLVTCTGAFIVSNISLLPFNYYNIHYVQKNPVEFVECAIRGVAINNRRSPDKLLYRFHGKKESIATNNPIIYELEEKENYDDYRLLIGVRKALLGSYYLDRWKIIKK